MKIIVERDEKMGGDAEEKTRQSMETKMKWLKERKITKEERKYGGRDEEA